MHAPDRCMITIVAHDPAWAIAYEVAAARIRKVLGPIALSIDHVGSTAVPGLPAKPVLDLTITVRDSTREQDYLPPLVSAGFALAIREPEWFEHRMLQGAHPATNLHVFSRCCPELERMRTFRNWLRVSEADAALYAETKRALAQRAWLSVEQYAEAKRSVIDAILTRALASVA